MQKPEFEDKPLRINPAQIKAALMKGNGNLIGSGGHTEVIQSSYQYSFKGSPNKFISKPLDLDWTASCSTGIVVPDPTLMKTSIDKFKNF